MPEDGLLRPEVEVLGEDAMIPPANLVRPPPNRFTHRLVEDAAYFYGTERGGAPPDGRLEAGARVVLLVDDDERCRVVDGQGLYVEVARASLARLPEP